MQKAVKDQSRSLLSLPYLFFKIKSSLNHAGECDPNLPAMPFDIFSNFITKT